MTQPDKQYLRLQWPVTVATAKGSLVDVVFGFQALDQTLNAGFPHVWGAGQSQLHLLSGLGVIALSAIDARHAGMCQPIVGILLVDRAENGKRFVLLFLTLQLAGITVQLLSIAHRQRLVVRDRGLVL